MRRRAALRLVGVGTASLAGCLGSLDVDDGHETPGTEGGGGEFDGGDTGDPPSSDPTSTGTDGPIDPAPGPDEECPTTQDLGVEWPKPVDRDAAEAFVAAYEPLYHREVAVDYEPETRLDSYETGGEVPAQAKSWGDGWQLVYDGGGGVFRPTLMLTANQADPPADADVVPASQIEDERLRALLADAAGVGDPEFQTDSDGADQTRLHVEDRETGVPRYLDLLGSLSDDFDTITEKQDSASTYVDVDGTAVELTAEATYFHRELAWKAWYYVDERVVRRRNGDYETEDIDARKGTLLECRHLD